MIASLQFLWMVSGRLEKAPVRPTKAKSTPSRCARLPLPKKGASDEGNDVLVSLAG